MTETVIWQNKDDWNVKNLKKKVFTGFGQEIGNSAAYKEDRKKTYPVLLQRSLCLQKLHRIENKNTTQKHH